MYDDYASDRMVAVIDLGGPADLAGSAVMPCRLAVRSVLGRSHAGLSAGILVAQKMPH